MPAGAEAGQGLSGGRLARLEGGFKVVGHSRAYFLGGVGGFQDVHGIDLTHVQILPVRATSSGSKPSTLTSAQDALVTFV